MQKDQYMQAYLDSNVKKKPDSFTSISSKCNGLGKQMLKQYFSGSTKNIDIVRNDSSNANKHPPIYRKMKNIEEVNKMISTKNTNEAQKLTFKPAISNRSKNLVQKLINDVNFHCYNNFLEF